MNIILCDMDSEIPLFFAEHWSTLFFSNYKMFEITLLFILLGFTNPKFWEAVNLALQKISLHDKIPMIIIPNHNLLLYNNTIAR